MPDEQVYDSPVEWVARHAVTGTLSRTDRNAQQVPGYWCIQPDVRKSQRFQPGDVEPRSLDGRLCITPGVAAAGDVRPHGGIEGSLDGAHGGRFGAHMLEEAKLSAWP